MGLETLAAAIGEDAGTLEDVYEPYLLQNGFLGTEPQEGVLQLPHAYEHLGYPIPIRKIMLYIFTHFDYNRTAEVPKREIIPFILVK